MNHNARRLFKYLGHYPVKPCIFAFSVCFALSMQTRNSTASNAEIYSSRDKCRMEADFKIDGGVDWRRLRPSSAIPLCEEAVSADPKDWTSLARLARALNKAGRFAEGAAAAHRAAEAGDALGQVLYGNALKYGEGIAKDLIKAVYWYKLAADKGHAAAEFNLAGMYQDGLGVNQDFEEANRWLRKAVLQQHENSQFLLGKNYEFGRGTPKDTSEAIKLYVLSAEQGYILSQKYLASKLRDGDIIEKDEKKAFYWLMAAADQGDPEAQKSVGSAFYNGVGVERDNIEATKWFKKAANQNYPAAQMLLGIMYADGSGIEKNSFEAFRWFERAANQGYIVAQSALGDAYREGDGVEANVEKAFDWYKRAADLGDGYSQARVIRAKISGSGVEQSFREAQDLTDKYFETMKWRNGVVASGFIGAELYDYGLTLIDRIVSNESFKSWSDEDRENFFKSISTDLSKCLTVGKGGEKTIAILEKLASLGMEDAAYQIGLSYYQDNTKEVDRPKALYWLKRAAEMGNVAAFNYVGVLYDTGFGEATNQKEATRWLRLAADKHDARGIGNLALQYAYGKGVNRDEKEALRLFKLAADQGDDLSFAKLAIMYADGLGVSRDPDKAADWYKFAAEKGYTRAQERIIASISRKKYASMINLLEDNPAVSRLIAESQYIYGELLSNRLKSAAQVDINRIRRNLPGAMAAGEFGKVAELHEIMARDFIALGDVDTALAERVNGVLANKLEFKIKNATSSEYFSLLSESCAWGQLSRWSYDHNKNNEALYFAKRSVNLLQEARKYLKDLPVNLRECFLHIHQDRYRWLADLFIEKGRLSEAEAVLRLLKDFEFTEYVRAASGSPDISAQRLALTSPEKPTDDAVEMAGRQLVQLETRRASLIAKNHAHILSGRDQAELDSLDNLSEKARQLFLDQLDEISVKLKDISRSVVDIERISQQNLTKFQSILADRVASGGPAEAIIQTVVLSDRVHLLLTTPNFQQVKTIDLKQNNLNKLIGDFRRSIQSRDDSSVSLGRTLYELLFKTFDGVLKAAGIHTVAISPDLGLSYLPFAALHDGDSYLVERYDFAILTDPAYAVSPTGSSRDWRIATFGVSKSTRETEALPSVAAELEGIARVAGERALPPKLDDAFTQSELAYAAGRYEVVHLATHFISTADESTSFLVLGDGARLSVQDLRKMRFGRTQLLTLSACDTAVPFSSSNGNQIDAVARSAQVIGGARSVVGTLWAVADSSTSIFMQRLYSLLLSNPNLSKGQAIAEVQRQFIRGNPSKDVGNKFVAITSNRGVKYDEPREIGLDDKKSDRFSLEPVWSKPFYWAPFLIMGNWS